MRASITLQLTGAAPLYVSPWNTLPSAHKILTRFCTYTPLPPLTVFFFLPAPALFSALILPDPLPRNCFVTSAPPLTPSLPPGNFDNGRF